MIMSRPTRARGLKLHLRLRRLWILWSRPTRARGLKLAYQLNVWSQNRSRPTRARGLKHLLLNVFLALLKVAPHAGAWIET